MNKLLEKLQAIRTRMEAIDNSGDIEINHGNADEYLILTLRAIIASTNDPQHKELLEDIIEAYNAVDKWYA